MIIDEIANPNYDPLNDFKLFYQWMEKKNFAKKLLDYKMVFGNTELDQWICLKQGVDWFAYMSKVDSTIQACRKLYMMVWAASGYIYLSTDKLYVIIYKE